MKVFCLGTVAADFYISENSSDYYIGGIASNVAIGLAHLGIDSRLITRQGNDKLGLFLRKGLESHGVTLISHISNHSTPIILVERDENHHISYVTHIENSSYAELHENDIPSGLRKNPDGTMLVLNGTILQNNKVHNWFLPFLSEYKLRGGIIVFDINWRDHIPISYYTILKHCLDMSDIIKGTSSEFSLLSSMNVEKYITSHFQDKICLLTKAEQGCTVYYQNKQATIKPVKAPKIIDPSGCGDAFVAGFIKGYILTKIKSPDHLSLENLIYCAQMGNYVASKIIAFPGANSYSETYTDTFLTEEMERYQDLIS